MAKRRLPRENLVANLERIREASNVSWRQMALNAKIEPKGLMNIINGHTAPTLTTVERLAASFGVEAWHLIMPVLPDSVTQSSVDRLLKAYTSASSEGRAVIEQIAEREAEYSRKKA